MAQLKIIYWYDIPGQVVIRKGRRSTRLRLSHRFADAIKRSSFRIKKQGKDALFDPWNTVNQECSGEITEQAELLVQWLEREYSDAVLDKLIHACGIDESRSGGPWRSSYVQCA